MEAILEKHIMPECVSVRWIMQIMVSLILPVAVIGIRPIGLTEKQALIVALVLLVIIWWSTGIVKKIPASIFLLVAFCLTGGAEYRTIFTFPLSETFPMIVITYLFSQGIANSGLVEHIIQPILQKIVHKPWQCLIAIMVTFYGTMYVIPQPLARVIIVASMFSQFLKQTDLNEETRSVLMYAVFLIFATVNMSAKDADMIMNHVAASFSETPISNQLWMHYMLIPTMITCVCVILLLLFMFRKPLLGISIKTTTMNTQEKMSGQQKEALTVILLTVVLWMTNQFHGLNNTMITVVASALLFMIGILHKKDLKTIDVTTLVFLSAAFSIGGVMKECGAADKVFGVLQGFFPDEFSWKYLLILVFASMVLHMILGSNTTTLSVAVPGMIIICSQTVSSPVIVFSAIVAVSFHMVLPFHSVAMMIGSSNGYFPARYVNRMSLGLTCLTFLSIVGIFYPYWVMKGLL